MARINDEATYWCRKYGALNLAQVIRGAMDWARSDAEKELSALRAQNEKAESLLAAEREKVRVLEPVIKAVKEYQQAIKDHAGDPCQCGNSPSLCVGDCGPANARKLLKALLSTGAGE